MTIFRNFPTKKEKKTYSDRYDVNDFIQYYLIISSGNYDKWNMGVNFETNRKIKIGGKTHNRLKYKHLYIKNHFFTDLQNINKESYLEETERINREIQDYNLQVDEYNIRVNDTINQIKSLETWNQYVTFEETKYGIPIVYNGIHRYNDCCGEMKQSHHTFCECNRCENWGGCGGGYTQYYKCDKCDYEISDCVSSSKNHKGK